VLTLGRRIRGRTARARGTDGSPLPRRLWRSGMTTTERARGLDRCHTGLTAYSRDGNRADRRHLHTVAASSRVRAGRGVGGGANGEAVAVVTGASRRILNACPDPPGSRR
jgi:hypothetical protein